MDRVMPLPAGPRNVVGADAGLPARRPGGVGSLLRPEPDGSAIQTGNLLLEMTGEIGVWTATFDGAAEIRVRITLPDGTVGYAHFERSNQRSRLRHSRPAV